MYIETERGKVLAGGTGWIIKELTANRETIVQIRRDGDGGGPV